MKRLCLARFVQPEFCDGNLVLRILSKVQTRVVQLLDNTGFFCSACLPCMWS